MEALLRSAALGDIVSVMMRAPRHKTLSLASLRVNVLPAVLHNQYLIARIRPRALANPSRPGSPVGQRSDEVDRV